MTKEELEDYIEKIDHHYDILNFFVCFRESEITTRNIHGKMKDWKNALKEICKSPKYIDEALPIEKVIFYTQSDAYCLIRNPFWVYEVEFLLGMDSHVSVIIPFLDSNANFFEKQKSKQL